jgi:hypothetical protein
LSIKPPDFQEEDTQSGHDTDLSWHNDSAILHYNQREEDLVWGDDDWIHDDAVVHYHPDEQDRPVPRGPSPPLHTYTPSTDLNPVPPTPQDPAGQGKGREIKVAKPRSRKKKAENNPTQLREADDAELKSRMLNAIREDDELYHRVLRYDVRLTYFCTPRVVKPIERSLQPIPLDDFEALAITLGFPTRGLQSKVMKFLDDQARPFPSARMAPNSDPEHLHRRFISRLLQAEVVVSIYFIFCFPPNVSDIRKLYLTCITIAILFCSSLPVPHITVPRSKS